MDANFCIIEEMPGRQVMGIASQMGGRTVPYTIEQELRNGSHWPEAAQSISTRVIVLPFIGRNQLLNLTVIFASVRGKEDFLGLCSTNYSQKCKRKACQRIPARSDMMGIGAN